MVEHSPADASVSSSIVEYVLSQPVNNVAFATPKSENGENGWKRMDWILDEAIQTEIEECQKRNQKLIDDSDASQLWWAEYGARWIEHNSMQC